MTKKVRIENADNSNHILVVQTWSKGADGADDVLLSEKELPYPTEMTEAFVWAGQYIVVKEKAA